MKYETIKSLNMKLTGEKIKELIDLYGWEDLEIADHLNVSDRTIKYWKSGERFPSIDNLFYLSKILGTTTDNLLCFENEEDSKLSKRDLKNKEYKIKSIEDFLTFLPLYDELILNDVLYRVSGESISEGTYMLEQFNYLYNHIKNKTARDDLSNRLESKKGLFNNGKILAIVNSEFYEMVKVAAGNSHKTIKNYIIDLVTEDLKKRELLLDDIQLFCAK